MTHYKVWGALISTQDQYVVLAANSPEDAVKIAKQNQTHLRWILEGTPELTTDVFAISVEECRPDGGPIILVPEPHELSDEVRIDDPNIVPGTRPD